MEQKTLIPRKVFSVMIYDKHYDVYDIEGKEHEGLNDVAKTWWIYYADRLPDGMLPSADSENFEPYHVGIKRICWELKFKQRNTTKEKWGHTNFSNNIQCEIWANGKCVYKFSTFDMAFALAKAQYLQTMICEHPYNFLDPETENGRKIFFYGLPATVKVSSHPGEIGIIPDYTVIEKDKWWNLYKERQAPEQDKDEQEMEDEYVAEHQQDDYINWGDALSDGNIRWFRK